jgi:hypothetical protein
MLLITGRKKEYENSGVFRNWGYHSKPCQKPTTVRYSYFFQFLRELQLNLDCCQVCVALTFWICLVRILVLSLDTLIHLSCFFSEEYLETIISSTSQIFIYSTFTVLQIIWLCINITFHTIGFWRWCITHRDIGFSDFVHRPDFS